MVKLKVKDFWQKGTDLDSDPPGHDAGRADFIFSLFTFHFSLFSVS